MDIRSVKLFFAVKIEKTKHEHRSIYSVLLLINKDTYLEWDSTSAVLPRMEQAIKVGQTIFNQL